MTKFLGWLRLQLCVRIKAQPARLASSPHVNRPFKTRESSATTNINTAIHIILKIIKNIGDCSSRLFIAICYAMFQYPDTNY